MGKVVPMWNYAAAEVYGRANIFYDKKSEETGVFLTKQIGRLSYHAETKLVGFTGGDNPVDWKVSDALDRFVALLQKSVIGIEIEITHMGGKLKTSQEMGMGDREGVIKGFSRLNTVTRKAMSELVQERSDLKEAKKAKQHERNGTALPSFFAAASSPWRRTLSLTLFTLSLFFRRPFLRARSSQVIDMLFLLPLLAALAAFPASVFCEDSVFIQPGGPGAAGDYRYGLTYEVGEIMEVQWDSDIEIMDIVVFQDYPKTETEGEAYYVNLKVSMDGFTAAKGEGTVFYMALYESGSTEWATTAHYFNVTNTSDNETVTTSAVSETTASMLSTNVPAPTSDAIESATSTAEADSASKSESEPGLSTGAVVGIAVGATIGGIVVLGAAGFFLWKHFRKGGSSQIYQAQPRSEIPNEPLYGEPKPGLAGSPHAGTQPVQHYAQSPGGLHEAP
ncbi:hypothetical protein FZEAL_2890 [Fusarium zealandicum]|uniref:Uncharacterized protein n=1 Tax=Fusarium zealandicum TaxID=1053134 RepID=A0A8H4XNF4_9HYPO|nr:hypothetical protein FZEAL_2890 [Fusarium zealandicum]